jgi:hypothetical protein
MEVARGLGLISASFLGGRELLHSSPTHLHLTQPHTNWSVRLAFELTCDANRYQGPKRRYVYIWQCVSYCPMAQPSFIEPDERRNSVHADVQASISWSLRVRNAVFQDALIAIQRKCSCDRIEDWIYIVMGCPQTLGLPCRGGSSLVALLGSICKAGDVESCCRAKWMVFICSDMPASSKSYGVGRSKMYDMKKTVCSSTALI